MKYALNMPPFGDFADPRALADLARDAESAGWDGFFIWDHVFFDPSFHANLDPWVGLAAVALTTTRIRIGTMVTPVARRRPWNLARQTVSVDQLSNGRLTLSVGLGDPVQWDFGFFNEETDAKQRAVRLDEGLDILTGLWRGEDFAYSGTAYQMKQVRFRPTPVQQPRIPIWVGGNYPNHPPMRRAAKYDGVVPLKWGAGDGLSVEDWRDTLTYIKQHRTSDAPFDAVHSGNSGDDPQADARHIHDLAEVGVTWWAEAVDPWRYGQDWEAQWRPELSKKMHERVLQGPPKG